MMHSNDYAQGGENNPIDKLIETLNTSDNSQEAYNQIADDLYACLARWLKEDIESMFALTACLDIIAEELRELLPTENAEEVIQDIISLHDGDV